MHKRFKNYFVPHKENDHKPGMLRGVSVTVLAVIAVIAFAFSAFHGALLIKNNDFLAAVLPGVLVDLANEDREENDLSPLTQNDLLEEAARLKAEHMAEQGYFAHESPDGVAPWDWFIEVGYQFTHAGENLAVNFVDSEDVEKAWMNSPGHRANLLNGSFTEVGIATARGEYEGRDTIFVVQMFGRPALAQAPTPTPQVAEASTEPTESEPVSEPEPVVPAESTPELEVVTETPTFVAVQDTSQVAEEELSPDESTEEDAPEDVSGAEAAGLTGDQSSLWERLATQPQTLLEWIYIIFGIILILVITATIIVEIEKQHAKHIVYGILLLILLLVLIYLNHRFVFPELLVI